MSKFFGRLCGSRKESKIKKAKSIQLDSNSVADSGSLFTTTEVTLPTGNSTGGEGKRDGYVGSVPISLVAVQESGINGSTEETHFPENISRTSDGILDDVEAGSSVTQSSVYSAPFSKDESREEDSLAEVEVKTGAYGTDMTPVSMDALKECDYARETPAHYMKLERDMQDMQDMKGMVCNVKPEIRKYKTERPIPAPRKSVMRSTISSAENTECQAALLNITKESFAVAASNPTEKEELYGKAQYFKENAYTSALPISIDEHKKERPDSIFTENSLTFDESILQITDDPGSLVTDMPSVSSVYQPSSATYEPQSTGDTKPKSGSMQDQRENARCYADDHQTTIDDKQTGCPPSAVDEQPLQSEVANTQQIPSHARVKTGSAVENAPGMSNLTASDEPGEARNTPVKNENKELSFIKLADVIDDLQRSEEKQHERPDDFDDFIQKIASIGKSRGKGIGPMFYSTDNGYYDVLLQGPGVKQCRAELEELNQSTAEYKLEISYVDPVFRPNIHCPVYAAPLAKLSLPFFTGHDEYNFDRGESIFKCGSSVGLILRDSKKDRLLAVTSGHTFLSTDEQRELSYTGYAVNTMREKSKHITGPVLWNKTHIVSSAQKPTYVNGITLLSYKYYVPEDTTTYYAAKCDIALISVLTDDLKDWLRKNPTDGIAPIECHQDQYKKKDGTYYNLNENTCIAGVLDISTPEEFSLLKERNILLFIGGLVPTLAYIRDSIEQVERSPSGLKMGDCLTFATDKLLVDGCSGSPIMAYNVVKDEFYIVAILNARSIRKEDREYRYEGTLLASALKVLCELYPDHIKGCFVNCEAIKVDQSITSLQKDDSTSSFPSEQDSGLGVSVSTASTAATSDAPISEPIDQSSSDERVLEEASRSINSSSTTAPTNASVDALNVGLMNIFKK